MSVRIELNVGHPAGAAELVIVGKYTRGIRSIVSVRTQKNTVHFSQTGVAMGREISEDGKVWPAMTRAEENSCRAGCMN